MLAIGGNSASTGYNLTRSLRFRASATAYLSRTPASTGNRRTFTFSTWLKRGRFATGTEQVLIAATNPSTSFSEINFPASSDILRVNLASGVAAYYFDTSMVFRDPSAWYHLVVAVDTTQASSANWIKTYVNGSQVVGTLVGSFQNYDTDFNTVSRPNSIGGRPNLNTWFYDGYQTEIYWIDGQALTPSSFGSTNSTTGVWQPARYTGTYGTNGFYLPFTDNSALTTSSNVGLGKDFSGNANYWVTNNISITAGVTYDSMTDVPTLTSATAANFAVLNPLDVSGTYLSRANQRITTGAAQGGVRSTMAFPTTAKIYFEVINASATSDPSTIQCGIGIANRSANLAGGLNGVTGIWGILWAASRRYLSANGSSSAVIIGELAINSTMQVAVDLANGYAWVGVNDTWYNASNGTTGNPSTGANATFTGLSGDLFGFADVYSMAADANFGQRPFTYTPPTGFVALNTYNLPTSTIVKGNTVMDATLYTGNGATGRLIANAAGFKPDLVWIKARSFAYNNNLYDSNRGAPLELSSNLASAEASGDLTAFNTTGFTVNQTASFNINESGVTYVGWQWQAGQGSSSSNTNGTITSTVSVNASAGFSVVTATSPASGNAFTLGHGLGVAPAFIISKFRSGSGNWSNYHVSTGAGGYLLFTTSAFTANTDTWNNTAPTSSVISTTTNWWGFSSSLVFYCWTPIAGFSAFGSYSGNNSTDGPMVYTGFQPKFVLIKGTGNASGWQLQDSARNTYNVVNAVLRPDLSAAESTGYGGVLDFLSNGFKLRTTDTNYNSSSYGPYIYMAFATNPFKNSLGF